ncbi:MAG TPA: ABC transporter permease [Dinghuibacter sp.]|uniref:ABC transporter permease n=1 Tax=Dinghuibacter sp. TaxID=2024697 RepID=UPI002BBD7A67|nr:ABC transporter permease [Dinghuibacter sp.]HTJ14458.1 ABC transporter permease [Dinghuibacter sp.]
MLRNYIKTAFRNFRKQKIFSALNLLGLTVGLATVLLITLYVVNEFNYDRYNVNADRLYRVNPHFRISGEDLREKIVPADLGPAMKRDYPVVENFVRFSNVGASRVRKGNAFITEQRTCWADSSLFQVFSLPLLAGDPQTALTQPHTVVISEAMAQRQFGALQPSAIVGRTLAIDDTTQWKITGVMADMPALSHVHYDLIRSLCTDQQSREVNWINNDWETYLLVRPGTTEAVLDRDLAAATQKYSEPTIRKVLGTNFDEMAKKGDFYRYETIPLTRIHLYSDLPKETEPGGSIVYVRMFMIIAIFILLLACVNFMNLSTARSAGRSREVGVRKVLGSRRGNLVAQFLVESILYSFGAMVLAFMLALLLLPFFSRLSGQRLTTATLPWYWLAPAAGAGVLVVGLLAGSYPAFFLSRFQPIQVLKGKLSTGFKGSWLRNVLVVFQFTTAVSLVVGSIVIYSQLNFIRNQRLGYDRSQVLLIQHTGNMGEHLRAFEDALSQLPGVRAVTTANSFPTTNLSTADMWFSDAAKTRSYGPEEWDIESGYTRFMGMTMANGRGFRPDMPSDTQGILINQTMARLMGISNPAGQNLYRQEDQGKLVTYHILGIVKDFHSVTLHEATPPLILMLGRFRDITGVRLNTDHIAATVDQVRKVYARYAGAAAFDYSFMDDDFNKLYASDARVGQVISTFTALALLVACLGLFGLVTFAAEQRNKEMSIRKVLGARVRDIIALLARDFVALILVSLVIAFPLAWYGMHRWLQSFAYRVNIGFSTFLFATLAILAAIALTIAWQAVRSATSRPVDALKSE